MAGTSSYQVIPDARGKRPRTMVARPGVAAASPRPHGVSECLPIAVSRAQAYYWKRTWQDAEREALLELETGQGRTFGDAESAIRYLLGPDD
jgi:hypothetical protein